MRRLCSFGFAVTTIALAVASAHCGEAGTRAFETDAGPSATSPDVPSGGTFQDSGTPANADASACAEDIDVVFVLDVSGSMGFVLDALDAEIAKVVAAANGLAAGAHFGLVLFVDNVLVDGTGDQGSGRIHTTADTLRASFVNAKATYTLPNRNPGDGPSGRTTQNPICEENALDALHDAATQFPWRPSSARVAILVTDDTFLERPDNYGDRDGDRKTDKISFPREGDYPARFTLDETVAELETRGIRVFSFSRLTAPSPFDPTACGTGRRHSSADSVTFGWSKPYAGKPPIPDVTGGKNFDLDAVRSGKVSLADTINEVVLQTHCAGPPK